MAVLIFDTHDFITELTEAGIDSQHARAISDGLKKINLDYVATKGDVAELRQEISDTRKEILASKTSLMQWFTTVMLGQAALVAALVKLIG